MIPLKGDDRTGSVYMVRHPQGSYIVNPLLYLEVATPENESIHRRCHPYTTKSASKAVLGRMKLTLPATRRRPHGASGASNACLVGANPTGSVPAL